MLALMRQEWKVCAAGLVVGLVLIIEPQWAFAAVRYSSAMIYSLLLAVQS
jgi:hypothetical protein